MARVTVEDCIVQIPDRFELVIAAAHRAKQISSGNPLTIDRDNDKDAVVALREIADQTIDLGQLGEELVQHFCRRYSVEAMEKALDKDTADDVQEAFEDARQHISADMGKSAGGESYGGFSFVEDNIETED